MIKIDENNNEIGTATCTIVTINPDTNELMLANMGDSGIAVLR